MATDYMTAVYVADVDRAASKIEAVLSAAFFDIPPEKRGPFYAAALAAAAQNSDELIVGGPPMGPHNSASERLAAITNAWQKK